jgi:hypothetical protein
MYIKDMIEPHCGFSTRKTRSFNMKIHAIPVQMKHIGVLLKIQCNTNHILYNSLTSIYQEKKRSRFPQTAKQRRLTITRARNLNLKPGLVSIETIQKPDSTHILKLARSMYSMKQNECGRVVK